MHISVPTSADKPGYHAFECRYFLGRAREERQRGRLDHETRLIALACQAAEELAWLEGRRLSVLPGQDALPVYRDPWKRSGMRPGYLNPWGMVA